MSGESKIEGVSVPELALAGAKELTAWRKARGISRTTAWYWRRTGKLNVIWRYGRAYVSAEESNRLLAGKAAKGRQLQQ